VLLLAGAGAADVVYLFDGSEMEGRVVLEERHAVVLEVEHGRVRIDRAKIERIERRAWAPRARPEAPEAPPSGAPGASGEGVSAPTATAAPLAPPARGDRAGGGSAPPGPADPRVAPLLSSARTALAPPGGLSETLRTEGVREWSDRLAALGASAVPTLALALAEETAPALAEAIERVLARFAGEAPGAPLVAALERRRLGATPALLRAAGAWGGAEGARVLLALIDEAEAEEKALLAGAGAGAPSRLSALREARAAAFDGLSAGGAPEAIPRLLARFQAAFASAEDTAWASGGRGAETEAERTAALDALCAALRRAGDEDGAPLAAGILSRARPPALEALLAGLEGLRWPAIRDAAARLAAEASALPATSPGRTGRLEVALAALRPFATRGDFDPDASALEPVLLLTADSDEGVRLAAVTVAGRSGLAPAISRLIEVYASDSSSAVQLAAQDALIREAGENLGTPEAFRDWWDARGRTSATASGASARER
jgi:hypothetical protein